jgi:hypothetical protein
MRVRHSAQEDGTVVSVGRDGVRVVFDLRYGKDQHSSVGLTMKNSSGLWPRPGELSWRQLAMSDQTETATAPGTREWIARFIRTERLRALGAGNMRVARSPDAHSDPSDYATAGCILAAIREGQK